MGDKIKTLVVDDSASVRRLITTILQSDPDIQVVGAAKDGVEGIKLIKALNPDVVTLDIVMPRLTGIGVIDWVMKTNPVRILVVSSITRENAQTTIRALEKGAIDFITKPSSTDIKAIGDEILKKVKTIAKIPMEKIRPPRGTVMQDPASTQEIFIGPDISAIGIGLSAGGPSTLSSILSVLPETFALPILVVQHMPKFFTSEFAISLDNACKIKVKEAEHNEEVKASVVYIAPGGAHMLVHKGRIVLTDHEPLNGHKPSVDVFFASLAEEFGSRVVGVVLTGMGNDGEYGSKQIRKADGRVVAQDQETSIVFGMPKAVIEAGHTNRVLSLERIPQFLVNLSKG